MRPHQTSILRHSAFVIVRVYICHFFALVDLDYDKLLNVSVGIFALDLGANTQGLERDYEGHVYEDT